MTGVYQICGQVVNIFVDNSFRLYRSIVLIASYRDSCNVDAIKSGDSSQSGPLLIDPLRPPYSLSEAT